MFIPSVLLALSRAVWSLSGALYITITLPNILWPFWEFNQLIPFIMVILSVPNQYTSVCFQFCPPGVKLLSDLWSSCLQNYGQLPDGAALHVFICTLCYDEQWVHTVQYSPQIGRGLKNWCGEAHWFSKEDYRRLHQCYSCVRRQITNVMMKLLKNKLTWKTHEEKGMIYMIVTSVIRNSPTKILKGTKRYC